MQENEHSMNNRNNTRDIIVTIFGRFTSTREILDSEVESKYLNHDYLRWLILNLYAFSFITVSTTKLLLGPLSTEQYQFHIDTEFVAIFFFFFTRHTTVYLTSLLQAVKLVL